MDQRFEKKVYFSLYFIFVSIYLCLYSEIPFISVAGTATPSIFSSSSTFPTNQNLQIALYLDSDCTVPLATSAALFSPGFPIPPSITYFNSLTTQQVSNFDGPSCITPSWLSSASQSAQYRCGFDGIGYSFQAREWYQTNQCTINGLPTYNVSYTFYEYPGGNCAAGAILTVYNATRDGRQQIPAWGSFRCPGSDGPNSSSISASFPSSTSSTPLPSPSSPKIPQIASSNPPSGTDAPPSSSSTLSLFSSTDSLLLSSSTTLTPPPIYAFSSSPVTSSFSLPSSSIPLPLSQPSSSHIAQQPFSSSINSPISLTSASNSLPPVFSSSSSLGANIFASSSFSPYSPTSVPQIIWTTRNQTNSIENRVFSQCFQSNTTSFVIGGFNPTSSYPVINLSLYRSNDAINWRADSSFNVTIYPGYNYISGNLVKLGDGTLIYLGGKKDTIFNPSVYYSNDDGNSWSTSVSSIPFGTRTYSAVSAFGLHSLYMVGGIPPILAGNPYYTAHNTSQLWLSEDGEGRIWTCINNNTDWKNPLKGHAMIVLETGSSRAILVTGGGWGVVVTSPFFSIVATNEVYWSNNNGMTFIHIIPPWSPRYFHQLKNDNDNYLYLTGGFNNTVVESSNLLRELPTFATDLWYSVDTGLTWYTIVPADTSQPTPWLLFSCLALYQIPDPTGLSPKTNKLVFYTGMENFNGTTVGSLSRVAYLTWQPTIVITSTGISSSVAGETMSRALYYTLILIFAFIVFTILTFVLLWSMYYYQNDELVRGNRIKAKLLPPGVKENQKIAERRIKMKKSLYGFINWLFPSMDLPEEQIIEKDEEIDLSYSSYAP